MAPASDLLGEGRALARTIRVGDSPFFKAQGVPSEAAYKAREAAARRIMSHAHIGYRSLDRTLDAVAVLADRADAENLPIARFGITLDWSMGYPADQRKGATLGTGIVLEGADDFARITHKTPIAAHFGDFMIGLPAALENTIAALEAGVTTIGNMGQYFTFRLPGWDDDVFTTETTVRALGLIGAQERDVLVHSNLDDGFAGLFEDVASALGMALVERHILEDLIGVKAAFCFGHHFSSPLSRLAFHAALSSRTTAPGSMIYGNTIAYQGTEAANYASLSSYLLADIIALRRNPTGHAINPVPVTENRRIPDVDEILDAQRFAARLAEHAHGTADLIDEAPITALADRLVAGGEAFKDRLLAGLADRGVDPSDPAALLLAIKRLGAKRIEALFGAGEGAAEALVPADWVMALNATAQGWVAARAPTLTPAKGLKVALGTTDVHEHGAYLVADVLTQLGIEVVVYAIAIDPDDLVAEAEAAGADLIAVSTYNGVGVPFVEGLRATGTDLPIIVGGKLNAVPEGSNTDLPVDVTGAIAAAGATPCADLDAMVPVLLACAARRQQPHDKGSQCAQQ
ncbi:MAG: cobalamin-dependent protein [Pseudomonadota bacterium]